MNNNDLVKMARAALTAARRQTTKEVVRRYVNREAEKIAKKELERLRPMIRQSLEAQMVRRLEDLWPAAVAACVLRSKVRITAGTY